MDKKDKALIRAQKNEKYISVVMEATGWDHDYAEQKMLEAKEKTGQNFEYYAAFRFWELSEDEQKSYFSKGDAERLRDIYNTDRSVLRQFWNKDKFCQNFEKYIGRAWMSTKNIKLSEFKSKFGKETKLIYKPKSASGGKGIQVFEYDEKSIESVYLTLKELPEGLIEGFINQHPEMKTLSVNAVNTIRVVTVYTNEDFPGVEKNKVNFLYTGLRMGKGDSYVDNMHSGGLIAGVNLETGIVETNGTNYRNEVFEKHPDTGVVLKGFQIPYFKELKALVQEAGDGICAYLGWDIAISETGPVVVEVNTHPGAEILQSPYVPEGKGMRHVIEKYLLLDNPEIVAAIRAETIRQNEIRQANAARKRGYRVPDAPYGPKISSVTEEGIEFYWKKIEKADGYEVFRSYEIDGEYELIADIPTRSQGEYMDSGFDSSKKKIYYKSRSYFNSEGMKIYSESTKPAVAVYRENMSLEREATYLYDGTERKLKAFYGWGEVDDAQWSSSDDSVAIVSSDGIVKAISKGEAVINCVSEKLDMNVTMKIVVNREAMEPLDTGQRRFSFNEATGLWVNNSVRKPKEAIIMMVGDLMCGTAQTKAQYTEENGWKYNDSYEYVKKTTAQSDFAIGNLETLMAPGWPYMIDEAYINNKNNCNNPSRYLDAVLYGGFDAVTMSNNHNCDGGVRALLDTIDQVNLRNIPNTGIFKTPEESRYMIVDINGIKVGFLAYMSKATSFNGKDADWTKEEKDTHLNVFTQEKATADIKNCRAAGAEYIIAYMHWGKKNYKAITEKQAAEAQGIADAGADYIIGANPHIVQAYDIIKSADGRKVPCFYSTGNFQAYMNQIPGNRDSVMVRIKLKKGLFGKIKLVENNYIPYHTYKTYEDCYLTPISLGKTYDTELKLSGRNKFRKRIAEAIGDKIKAI